MTLTRILPTLLVGSALAGSGCVQVSVCETHLELCTADGDAAVDKNCETIPRGAVGVEYAFDLDELLSGVYGTYGEWEVSDLPPGLSLEPDTGIISGVPTEPGVVELELTVTDLDSQQQIDFSCGELDVNERLSALDVRFEEDHCIPHTVSRTKMLALLAGGDGSEVTCRPFADGSPPCVDDEGDGNGRLPPGISFDASTCTHSGEISSDRRGTWVWMVEIEQSGYVTSVPFCATNNVAPFHHIDLEVGGETQSDLDPLLFEYDPDEELAFGQGDYVWWIDDPICPDSSECEHHGYEFDVSCSPFDEPFSVEASSTEKGFEHDLTASGPAPSESFRHRPWVASFDFNYCTAADKADCDPEDNPEAFQANAQTKYHFNVVAFPVEP